MLRNWISIKIARYLNLVEKSNWNAAALHDLKTFTCDRGNISKEKKKAANEKDGNFTEPRKQKDVQRKNCDEEESF